MTKYYFLGEFRFLGTGSDFLKPICRISERVDLSKSYRTTLYLTNTLDRTSLFVLNDALLLY